MWVVWAPKQQTLFSVSTKLKENFTGWNNMHICLIYTILITQLNMREETQELGTVKQNQSEPGSTVSIHKTQGRLVEFGIMAYCGYKKFTWS